MTASCLKELETELQGCSLAISWRDSFVLGGTEYMENLLKLLYVMLRFMVSKIQSLALGAKMFVQILNQRS